MIYELITSANIVTAILFTAVFILVRHLTSRPRGIPPGPRGIPLLGNLLSLHGQDSKKVFQQLRKQYGDVFSIYFGSQLVIVINGFESIKHAFVRRGDDFSSRPHNFLTDELSKNLGIINMSSSDSKPHRKFLLAVLREFGFGKPILETKIQEEIRYFLSDIDLQEGTPFHIKERIQKSFANVVNSVACGKRFPNDDPTFITILANEEYAKNAITRSVIALLVFPWIKWLPGDLIGCNALLKKMNIYRSYTNEVIKQHMESFDENNIRDLIDAYLKERKGFGSENPNTLFEDEQIMSVIRDLLGAGAETTATTIQWALIYMTRHPETQRRLQSEIDEEVGRGRLPSLSDRHNLPYTEAFLNEVQRISDIVPFSLPYGIERDITFHGYTFPKGTTVFMNINSVLSDPDIWENPNEFRPERFLDENMQVRRYDEFIPFSIGRRMCLGESLAKMELFLFMSAMVQRFTFLPPEGDGPPSLDGELQMTYCPKPFMIRAVPRP